MDALVGYMIARELLLQFEESGLAGLGALGFLILIAILCCLGIDKWHSRRKP